MNRIRQPIFFIFVVFVCFSVMPVFSSTGGTAPKLQFTKWQAGQGQEYTVSNPPHTFITDTETTCQITATVAYASSQPSSVYPLTSYTWSVTGSHGYTFTTETTASGAIDQIGTTFTLTATGTGDQHNSSTGGHRPMRGREEKPITFTVKFIGEYGSGSGSDQQTVEVEVVFEQDEKDQMRQEYLDVRRLHKEHRSSDTGTYGDLRIPSRGELGTSGQRFNNGHYSYLINKSLEDKILHWWQACDKVAYEALDNDDLKNDRGNKELRLTGGYRNPHHHVYHVYAGQSMSDVTYWSLHQFGLALDVGEVDMNGKNDIEGGYNGIDGNFMEEAARDYAGASWTSNNYRTEPHVHAQWGAVRNAPGKDSTSSQRSTKKTTTVNPITTTPETTPTTVTGACGVHTIASSETSQHVEKTGACGHKYYACTPGNHDKLQASCSTDSNCISTNFYLCQHTSHEYSRSEGRTCGHTPRHRWSFCPKNAAGERCIYHVYFRCTPHTHKYRNGETVVYTPPGETQQPRETQQPTQQPTRQTQQPNQQPTQQPTQQPPETQQPTHQTPKETQPPRETQQPTQHPKQPCGHRYETGSSSEFSHRSVACPTKNGVGHTAPEPIRCPANSWTNCGGTSSHATTCRAGHTYYRCNRAAVNAHKWHRKAGVNCPAHAWTNCNGSSSHQTTCGRGHKYYTCNPSARRAHGWH